MKRNKPTAAEGTIYYRRNYGCFKL